MTFDVLGGIPEVKSVVRQRSAVEDILERGRAFYRDDVDAQGHWIGHPLALRDALAYAGPNGFVATMPELIAARVAVAVPADGWHVRYDKSHWLWTEYATHTEENVGPNYTREFYPDESHLVVVVHGGGLLTPELLLQNPRSSTRYVHYKREEFEGLLHGRLPGGDLPLVPYDDILSGEIPRRCGIVLPYSVASRSMRGNLLKKRFIENPLMIARNAGVQHLEEYFDRASFSAGLNADHLFGRSDPPDCIGYPLSLSFENIEIGSSYGRFVGVRRSSTAMMSVP